MPYNLADAYYDYFTIGSFKREVACFAAEGMGVIAMSSQNRAGLVEFDFFKIWEAMKAAPVMPKNVWMIHTHPHGVNSKSEEDTSSVKGWATALGMTIEMVIGTDIGDIHYRCLPDLSIVRRGYRNDSVEEKILMKVMRGMSCSNKVITKQDFDSIVKEVNGQFPTEMWRQFLDPIIDYELWGGDKTCKHVVENSPGGGVNCTNCSAWFCF